MKRYEFKVTVDLKDDTDITWLADMLSNLNWTDKLYPGESVVSLEYTEVPIPELPT
jgi:hypothetical protein